MSNARRKHDRYLRLQRKINYDQLKNVKKFPIFRLGKNKGGLLVDEHNVRETPFGNLAFRTIGLFREEGKSVGIEAGYDQYLKGKPGKRLMQKIMGGNWVPLSDDNEIEPQNGYDVYTTIDMNMQDVTEKALSDALEKQMASHGCAILMETKTGYIKAIANLTRKPDGTIVEDKNYAISEITEPGSTFKLASVLALLEDNPNIENEAVNSEDGTTQFADRTMRDSEHGGHGMLTLQKSFELSSNVGISKFVWNHYKNNPSKYINHLVNDFKLSQPLHIGIPGEGLPLIKSPKDKSWSDPTLPWMSIGYEVLITPMHTLTLYNAIANNGCMVRPQLVTKIEKTGKLVQEFSTQILNPKIVSTQTIKRIMPMMTGVVEHGTATNLRNNVYSIAGKTGTARIVQNGKYIEEYKSSFCGFFPADNPQYTCMVMIFRPSNGVYYGSAVAGPVFKEIADKIYATNVTPKLNPIDTTPKSVKLIESKGNTEDFKVVLATLGQKVSVGQSNYDSWSYVQTQNAKSVIYNKPQLKNNQMPDVKGMKLKDALYILENLGLIVAFDKPGKVISQSLEKGEIIYKGKQVSLTTTLN
ncbi:MAG: transpeptidase family protein [Bacteroidetes bacterium]|nr:transpeptidase family protein [Bacteroidota bacterium]